MSRLYNRPRTPPSPPSISQKSSSRNSRHTSKSYDEPSKSYSSRSYEKYDSYDKYDKNSKYDKSVKYDHYDKGSKSEFKSSSYLSEREYSHEYSPSMLKESSLRVNKFSNKSSCSYSDETYKPKRDSYPHENYSERNSFVSKYPSKNSNDKFSKYASPSGNDISRKYSSHSLKSNMSDSSGSDKKYTYGNSKSTHYSKYRSEDNSFYSKDNNSFDCYDSFRQEGNHNHSEIGKRDGDTRRNYSSGSLSGNCTKRESNTSPYDSYEGGYQRYVIGDSVVYGSPGHYPKDVYPSSPKSRRARSPHSPSPLISSSKTDNSKPYSRYSSSPHRYRNSSSKGLSSREETSYSRSGGGSAFRKPPSPPPHSYQNFSSQNNLRNDRSSRDYAHSEGDKSYDGNKNSRYFSSKSFSHGQSMKSYSSGGGSRGYNDYRGKGDPYSKSYSSYDDDVERGNLSSFHQKDRFSAQHPKPLMAPKPLLSIPLSVSSLPKESRANIRQTLGIPSHRPLNGLDKPGRVRRFDGRIGARKRAVSPKDKRRRRPDDLRLWIESRKTGVAGSKAKSSSKRPLRNSDSANRTRIPESRKRLLTDGKKKGTIRNVKEKINERCRQKLNLGMEKRVEKSNTSKDQLNRSRREEEGTKKRKDSGVNSSRKRTEGPREGVPVRGPGSTANTRRPIKRPRNISQVNRLPIKPRKSIKKTSHRSPLEKDRGSTKIDKTYQLKTKERERPRSHSRTRDRSPRSKSHSQARQRSRSRSPKRNDNVERERSPFPRH